MANKKPCKYIILFDGYIDCPTCDSMSDTKVTFANSFKEILEHAECTYGDSEIVGIYSKYGKELPLSINYIKYHHNVHGMEFKIKDKKVYDYVDNGRGKKVWMKSGLATEVLYRKKRQ